MTSSFPPSSLPNVDGGSDGLVVGEADLVVLLEEELEERHLVEVRPHPEIGPVIPVEDVVVDDGAVAVGERVFLVAVRRVLGVEPLQELVEHLLDAVGHVLPDGLVGFACK